MAIARDTSGGTGTAVNTGQTTSVAIAGANEILFAVSYDEGGGTQTRTITYNGVSMTQLVTVLNTNAVENITIFYLANPATGTHNLISSLGTSSYNILTYAAYTGASNSAPTSYGSNTTTSATSLSVTGLSTANSNWFVGFAVANTFVSGTNATSLVNTNSGYQVMFDSNGIASSGTAQVGSGVAFNISMAVVSFGVAGAAANKSNFLAFM
jgi:hypothetical protein